VLLRMFHRARLVFALLALAMQWCVPLAHAVHEAAVVVPPVHHQQHDDGGDKPDQRHDESHCPTCQQFASLRTCAPLVAPVALVAVGRVEAATPPEYLAPFVSHFSHAPAVPRGPPVR
jgi:hypothetical protein